jgi:hypothetical protein
MRFVTGIVIYLVLGVIPSLYAADILSENQESTADVKSVGYSPDAQNVRESYADWNGSHLKKEKKVPVRQRVSAPYRGFVLINLAATTSVSESTSSFESEQTRDNREEGDEGDEGIIEVVYAKELLNQNIEIMAPTLTNYEHWQ